MFRQNSQTSDKISFNEAIARFFLLPAFVTPPAYIFETIVASAQFGKPWLSGFRGNSQLGRGFYYAYIGGLIKGGSCGVKEPLTETFETAFCAKRSNIQEEMTNIGWGRRLSTMLGYSAGMSALDSAFSHYPANARLHAYFNIEVPRFKKPQEFFKYGTAGFLPRWVRTNLGLFLLMLGKPSSEKFFNDFFPQNQFGPLGSLFSYLSLGPVAGAVTMPPDKVWKRSVLEMDLRNFTIPPLTRTIKNIMREEGMRGFTRGTAANTISMTALFAFVSIAEYGLDNYIFPKKKDAIQQTPLPLAPRLFKCKRTETEEMILDSVFSPSLK